MSIYSNWDAKKEQAYREYVERAQNRDRVALVDKTNKGSLQTIPAYYTSYGLEPCLPTPYKNDTFGSYIPQEHEAINPTPFRSNYPVVVVSCTEPDADWTEEALDVEADATWMDKEIQAAIAELITHPTLDHTFTPEMVEQIQQGIVEILSTVFPTKYLQWIVEQTATEQPKAVTDAEKAVDEIIDDLNKDNFIDGLGRKRIRRVLDTKDAAPVGREKSDKAFGNILKLGPDKPIVG